MARRLGWTSPFARFGDLDDLGAPAPDGALLARFASFASLGLRSARSSIASSTIPDERLDGNAEGLQHAEAIACATEAGMSPIILTAIHLGD